MKFSGVYYIFAAPVILILESKGLYYNVVWHNDKKKNKRLVVV